LGANAHRVQNLTSISLEPACRLNPLAATSADARRTQNLTSTQFSLIGSEV
jgi:hypothetical protein